MVTKGILGKKGLTKQAFNDEGERMPVTHIHTSPCYIIDVKTSEKEGYWSMKLGFDETKTVKKSRDGITHKAGIKAPLRFLKEIRFDAGEAITDGKKRGIKVNDVELWVRDTVKAGDIFAKNDSVDVTGTSKGKGFQGVVKRHGFAGGPKTHGQSDRHRAPGSIGSGTTPGRVYKGKRMAGRMGGDTVTIQNLLVVDAGEDFIAVKGLVPGAINGYLVVRSASPMPEKPVEEVEVVEEAPVAEVAPVVEAQVAEEAPTDAETAVDETPVAEPEGVSTDEAAETNPVEPEQVETEEKA